MKIAFDIECDALINPSHIWLVCCKDIDTGEKYVFRGITEDDQERGKFLDFALGVTLWVGHNCLGYDLPILTRLVGLPWKVEDVIDTLIISKLVDYSREGHSIEAYGIEFNVPKGENYYPEFFSKWSQELENYCVRDVDICERIYLKYARVIHDQAWHPAIGLEHQFQLVVNSLHDNGFAFNSLRAGHLLEKITEELNALDTEITRAFPAKLRLVKEVHPRVTKHGTLNRGDFRFVRDNDLSDYNGGPFCRCEWTEFNPSSHKQLIEVLHGAGWSPSDKTQTHIDTERELQRLRYARGMEKPVDLEALRDKLQELQKTGWKINETNLETLPKSAPSPARTLAKRILLEARRRSLTEWLGLVQDDGRIHGNFYGIGAWTHRMAHQRPNTANIPNEFETSGKKKLLGKELRSLWQAPRNRLLVGVDAEGIQLRIFAHYINDPEFTDALVKGKKDDKTDPHSLNQRILGSVCKSRAAAKRFIFALLLGAGIGKLAQILECSRPEAEEALARLIERYSGFKTLKETVIPSDAKRAYFIGLDGRKVRIPGTSLGERKHLCMSGYLQTGEAVVMKRATLKWHDLLKQDNAILVNLVHDEWQTEVPNNMDTALRVAEVQAQSLKEVGDDLKLRCPLAGSYWNDDHKDYTIGTNWYATH